MKNTTMLSFCVIWFTFGATSAQAEFTLYTNSAAWEAAVGGQFLTENFTDTLLNPGVSFESSESGGINTAFGYYQDVLASQSNNEPRTIWHFTPEITAYGGTWTLGGPGGSGNSLLVYVADVYVGFISNSYNGEFWGFVSDSPFSSVTLIGGSGDNQQHYLFDDMVYAPVPEPGIPWLLGFSLGSLLFWRAMRGYSRG